MWIVTALGVFTESFTDDEIRAAGGLWLLAVSWAERDCTCANDEDCCLSCEARIITEGAAADQEPQPAAEAVSAPQEEE